jgi:phage tail-like protein
MSRPLDTDPLRNFKFRVEIQLDLGPGYGPMAHLGFMAASGLAATTEPISYREGGDNTTPRKMPGQTDFPPVSLTRGLVGNRKDVALLWAWYRKIFFVQQGSNHGIVSGQNFRADTIYIRVFDHPVNRGTVAGEAVGMGPIYGTVRASWKLFNAWPASLAFSDLDAGGNGVLVNNLTLMYEGFDFATEDAGAAGNRLAGNW